MKQAGSLYKTLFRRQSAPVVVPVPDAVRPVSRQSVPAKPPVGTLPSAAPQPEPRPVPAGPEPVSHPSISAFRQVIPQAANGTHPPKEASYVWE
jgi:hypothetical protein